MKTLQEYGQRLDDFFLSEERVLKLPHDGNPVAASRILHRLWTRRKIPALWGQLMFALTYLLSSGRLKNRLLRMAGLHLGKNAFIAAGASIDFHFPQLITIGDDVIIGTGARILTHEVTHDHIRFSKVHISHGATIGVGAIVRGGVVIGEGAIVGMGALVLRDVPDHVILTGVPDTAHSLIPPERRRQRKKE